MKKKMMKFTIKLLISLAFLALVVFKTNWPDFFAHVSKVSIFSILIYLALLVLSMVVSAYKWHILANFKGFKHSVMTYFKLYLAGTFINNFMPSFVAGDAFKAYEIAKDSKRYSEAASTVMMDRITGLIGAMFLAIFFSIINLRFTLANPFLIIINILMFLSLGSDVLIANLKKWRWLREWVKRILPAKVSCFLADLYSYSDNKSVIQKSVLWGMIFNFLGVALLNLVLFWSLGISVNILGYLSVIFIISIISALPITVNNIGLKEWAYITFFGLLGVSSGAATAVAVLSRFLQMLVSFTAFPVYLKSRGERLLIKND